MRDRQAEEKANLDGTLGPEVKVKATSPERLGPAVRAEADVIDYLEKPGGRFRDRLDPKVADWILPYDSQAPGFHVAFMGAPLSKTSISHSAAFRLPDAIRQAFQALTPYSVEHRLALNEVLTAVDFGNVKMHATELSKNQQRIEDAVFSYWKNYASPLVLLGGDHSITGSSVLGYVRSTGKHIGIIHFDAHHDVRNLEDGGRTNGTPFRTILSSGLVEGNHVVQIGLRDFVNAKAYHEYVLQHEVTVYTARDVVRQGMLPLLKQAMEVVAKGTDAVYVSFDVDVLDQSFVPGVPAPSPGGLTVWDALDAMIWLGQKSNVEMLDVVCADPVQDVRDLTTRVAANLVLSFLTGMGLKSRE